MLVRGGKGTKATLKQKLFAGEYVRNGGNATQAAMKTYHVKGTGSAKSVAMQNIKKPVVQDEIKKILDRAGLGLDSIATNLQTAVRSGLGVKATNSDSLRGIDMLLKLHNVYPDKITKKLSYSVQQHLSGDYKDTKEALRQSTAKAATMLNDVP